MSCGAAGKPIDRVDRVENANTLVFARYRGLWSFGGCIEAKDYRHENQHARLDPHSRSTDRRRAFGGHAAGGPDHAGPVGGGHLRSQCAHRRRATPEHGGRHGRGSADAFRNPQPRARVEGDDAGGRCVCAIAGRQRMEYFRGHPRRAVPPGRIAGYRVPRRRWPAHVRRRGARARSIDGLPGRDVRRRHAAGSGPGRSGHPEGRQPAAHRPWRAGGAAGAAHAGWQLARRAPADFRVAEDVDGPGCRCFRRCVHPGSRRSASGGP